MYGVGPEEGSGGEWCACVMHHSELGVDGGGAYLVTGSHNKRKQT